MSQPPTEKQLRDLSTLLEISRSMAATTDLERLLQLIIDQSMVLLDAERASLFLYDADNDELFSRIAAGANEIRFPADRGVAGSAVKTGQIINVPDAYQDDRFNPNIDKKTGFRTRSILAVPLCDYEGQLVGVLQILNKRGGPFGEHDEHLAETLAAQAGVIVQRARLLQHYVEKQRMERAMQLAREIQRNLLPSQSPAACGFDIAGFCQPADETGGDTYDFMLLPGGQWMVVVADATGHGIGPALVIAETRAILRAVSLQDSQVSIILQTVNNLLTRDLADSRFVTCFFGMLDPLAATFTYASAGHGPLLFYDHANDTWDQENATGLPLGLMEESPYEETLTRKLITGDLAVITTDGFFEATNSAGEQFGIERMMELLREHHELPAAEIIERLRAAVAAFSAGEAQADDLTAVVIKKR